MVDIALNKLRLRVDVAGGELQQVKDDEDENATLGNDIPPVQTDMSGAFTVHNVHPGTYYFRIDYPGYLTPLLAFKRTQFAHPTPDIQKRIASELQIVTVAPHAVTTADTTILRGAAISGTVRYDDGSPAPGIYLELYRRNPKGEFKDEYDPPGFSQITDDRGQFHITSLPTGEFVLAANFSISEAVLSSMPMPDGKTVDIKIDKTLFSLPLFSGDALRLRDAAIIKLDTGQESSGNDLTLPLSKLHPVTGSVIAQDGHTINSAKVSLLYADTREELTNVLVSRDDGQFHFLYVPEADYILSVKEAADITQIEVANPPGVTPRTRTEDKAIHTYSDVEQPLAVQNDVASVLATVPDKKSSPTTTAAP